MLGNNTVQVAKGITNITKDVYMTNSIDFHVTFACDSTTAAAPSTTDGRPRFRRLA